MSRHRPAAPLVVVFVTTVTAFVAGCGGAPAEPAKAPARAAATAGKAGSLPPGPDPLPSLDGLAARGPTLAPLMREALRVADAKTKPELRPEKDTCVRAVIAASAPVKAYFADAKSAPRGDAFEGTEGAVPPNGPACVKGGDVVRLVVEGDAAARAVVFAAP